VFLKVETVSLTFSRAMTVPVMRPPKMWPLGVERLMVKDRGKGGVAPG